jgi:UDP-glucose 4-epimerase
MKVLVTGGAGYIGSHTVVELLRAGYEAVIVDNFSNSSPKVISRILRITGRRPQLYEGNVQNKKILTQVFDENQIGAVMHFAGLKSVGVSVRQPLAYFRTNLNSTLSLLEVMRENSVKRLIFSSSATVYGNPDQLPLRETSRAGFNIASPYGRTKYMIEQILSDLAASEAGWEITSLRYFNPIGAHASGLIGEDPHDIPNNLSPFISQVAVGRLDKLLVFGGDYDTLDGTGVRDYIHVVDLAKGHVAALENLRPAKIAEIYNLGRGIGASVLEVIRSFEAASGVVIPYKIVGRRPGDVASSYADVSKARLNLNWQALKSLDEACADSWRWQSLNPNGFQSPSLTLAALAR